MRQKPLTGAPPRRKITTATSSTGHAALRGLRGARYDIRDVISALEAQGDHPRIAPVIQQVRALQDQLDMVAISAEALIRPRR